MNYTSFQSRILTLFLLMLYGATASSAATFTIDFNKGTKSGTEISSSLPSSLSTLCKSGAENAKSITGTNCFYNSGGCGIRMGKSGVAGSVVVTLSEALQAANVKEVVIYASTVSDVGVLKVKPAGSVTTETSLSPTKYSSAKRESADYALSPIAIGGKLTSLTLKANSGEFVHLHRIDIVTDSDNNPPVTTKTLKSITLSGQKTSFSVGESFSFGGVVTASYMEENVKDADVTSSTLFSGYDMSVPGIQTVTATYTEGDVTKTASYDINVISGGQTFTITWSVNGNTAIIKPSVVVAGNQISFPTDVDDIDGKKFQGWIEAESYENASVAPTFVESAIASENRTYYAVFASQKPTSISLEKMNASYHPTSGDNIVIVANGGDDSDKWEAILYQQAYSSFYIDSKMVGKGVGEVLLTPDGISADEKNYFTLTASGNNTWKIGDSANGYLQNNSGGNELKIDVNDISGYTGDWTIEWKSTKSKFAIKAYRNLACRNDLSANKYKFNCTTGAGTIYFDIYKYEAGEVVTSGYCTNFPLLTFDVSECWVSEGAHINSPVARSNQPKGGRLTYSVTAGDAAEVSADGVVSVMAGKTGDVTVTASVEEDGIRKSASASYVIHVVEPEKVAVSTAGWATFAPSRTVELPNDVYRSGKCVGVYHITANRSDNKKVVFADTSKTIGENKTIGSATGVLVKAEAGEYHFPVNTTIAPTEVTGNLLVGVLTSTPRSGDNSYIFKNGSLGVGFYPWTTGEIAAGKCYLQLSEAQAKTNTFIGIPTDEELTAVESVLNSQKANDGAYNLNGQKIDVSGFKGIVIRNNKKILMK